MMRTVMMMMMMMVMMVMMVCGDVKGVTPPPPPPPQQQQHSITLTTTGYRGVKVALSNQLNKDKCQLYIDYIKELFQATTLLLFTATGEMVYFGEVVIVVGKDWLLCEGITATPQQETHTWESSHVRIGPSHYLFADHPWTQHPGGCGDPGDWIYLSEVFLLNRTMGEGTEAHVLAHEWAKYRWGVFEEYGHTSDPIFPSAYRDQNNNNNNNTIQPNYCTDHTLTGNMSCPDGGSVSECVFIPDVTQNTTIKSSLLAVPFINTVTNFCDSSTHNAGAPTKHNLLCDRKSTMDVILKHEDMTGSPLIFQETTFKVVRETDNWPKRVLLVEYSAIMGDGMVRGRWEQLRDNVRQYINKEAEEESYLGVVVFGKEIFNTSVTVLPLNDITNRLKLAEYIPDLKPEAIQGTRNLYMAIQRGVQVLGPQGGTLILLTHNLEYQTPQNLVNVADNNSVWPILYPSMDTVLTDEFDALANISPDTHVIKIPNDKLPQFPMYQSVETSASIHNGLLTAFGSVTTRKATETCRMEKCEFKFEMSNTTYNGLEAYIKVFTSIIDATYLNISVKDPYGRQITGVTEWTILLYPVAKLQNGIYTVSIDLNSAKMVVVEFWVTPPPGDFELTVWSPKGLHSLDYSLGVAPRLLVKMTKNTSLMVLFAAVTVTMKGKVNTGGGTTMQITMNDEGFGADVTGRDGIYSAFLVGFKPGMDADITISVTDNNGNATAIDVTQMPATTTADNVCCGSQLDLSNLQQQNIGKFVYQSNSLSGRFTGVDPGVFPPGRVTDLQATLTGNTVTLHFTAPGAQLDQGTADRYFVNWHAIGDDTYQTTNITGVPPGSPVESTITLGKCDVVYSITVVAAYNGINGSSSNVVTELVPCNGGGGGGGGNGKSTPLSAGAIAGITIGCLVGLLLIVLIVYLCLNSDRLDELWICHLLTCRCCRCRCCGGKRDDDDLYSKTQRRSDFVRTTTTHTTTTATPIRTLNDLYAAPNVQTKKDARQTTAAAAGAQQDDDGGFGERRSRQQKIVMRPLDLESVASSRSTMPINQVGLPAGTDNHAYDDGPYTVYSNAPPPVPTARSNTQV